jgi:hypothetical protein
MPKSKTILISKVNEMINKYPKELEKSGDKLICKLCLVEISFDHKHGKDRVMNHFQTKGHVKKRSEQRETSQPLIENAFRSAETVHLKNEFFADMTKMLIEANIPIEKLMNESFRQFMAKYTSRDIPSPDNLRKHYVPQLFREVMDKIRTSIGSSAIYLVVDETSDAKNRYVVNIMVGALNGEPSKAMLLSTTFVDRTNNKTVSQCIIDSLGQLWSGAIHYDRLWLIVSDQASYLLKAVKNLKDLFPNLRHITCIAHALHRVSLIIKDENPEVNQLISLFKEIMVKSPLREYEYKEQTGLPMPPKPVITRWNTWLLTAFYYAENFGKVKTFIEKLNNSSEAIKCVKQLVNSRSLEQNLLNLKELKFITEAITTLQTQNLKTTTQLEILKSVKSRLSGKALQKLDKSLAKNPDLETFTSDGNDYEFKSLTKFAPLVSTDIERSFSKYKEILSDKRQNMALQTIEYLNIICFNSFLK